MIMATRLLYYKEKLVIVIQGYSSIQSCRQLYSANPPSWSSSETMGAQLHLSHSKTRWKQDDTSGYGVTPVTLMSIAAGGPRRNRIC